MQAPVEALQKYGAPVVGSLASCQPGGRGAALLVGGASLGGACVSMHTQLQMQGLWSLDQHSDLCSGQAAKAQRVARGWGCLEGLAFRCSTLCSQHRLQGIRPTHDRQAQLFPRQAMPCGGTGGSLSSEEL